MDQRKDNSKYVLQVFLIKATEKQKLNKGGCSQEQC